MPPAKAEAVPEEDIHTDKVLPPPQPPIFAISSHLTPVALGGLETKIPSKGRRSKRHIISLVRRVARTKCERQRAWGNPDS